MSVPLVCTCFMYSKKLLWNYSHKKLTWTHLCFICWNGCWIFFICKIRIKIKCAHYWIAFLVLFHKSDIECSLKMVLNLCTVYIQTLFVRYHKTPAMHIIIAFFFIHKCLVHHTKLLVFIPTYLAQLLLVPPICFIVGVCHPLVCQ